MQRVPGDALGDRLAGAAPGLRLVDVRRRGTRTRARAPRGSGATTTPVSRSWTISSGPPASVVVTTGFSDRNASYGTIPKSSSTGA